MMDINYLIDLHVKESVTIHALRVFPQIHLLVQVVFLVIFMTIFHNLVLKIFPVFTIAIFVLLEIVFCMEIVLNARLRIVKDVMQVTLILVTRVLQVLI